MTRIQKVTDTESRNDRRVKKALREKDWHWAYNVMLAGLFLGLFSLAYVGNKTMVSFGFLSRALALCCCIGLLIPMRFYLKWLGLGRLEAFLFNVMGVGPLLCGLLLWGNFLIRTDEQTVVYRVVKKELTSAVYFSDVSLLFTFADSAYADNPEMRRFEVIGENLNIVNATRVKITTAQGMLGYDVLVEKEAL